MPLLDSDVRGTHLEIAVNVRVPSIQSGVPKSKEVSKGSSIMSSDLLLDQALLNVQGKNCNN